MDPTTDYGLYRPRPSVECIEAERKAAFRMHREAHVPKHRKTETRATLNSTTPDTWCQLNYVQRAALRLSAITHPDDRLFVTDLWFPKQECTAAAVEFDDESIAEEIDRLSDTHPMDRLPHLDPPRSESQPQWHRRRDLLQVLGHFDWAVMAILAKGGKSYARIKHDAPAGITDGKIEYKIPWYVHRRLRK